MQGGKRFNKICNDNVPPDSEILAWEKWIQIRKEETEHLSKKTGRAPVDLVMNTLEDGRKDKERKILLEHAQIQRKFTIRNNVVWEDPARLSQICPCKPSYEAHRTKAELGRPKVIERVAVPKIIQETEKGLTGSSKKKPFRKLDADYVQYRRRRENELQYKIKKLDPYRPEFDDLIVTGTKPGLLKKVSFSVPVLKLEIDTTSEVHEQTAVYAVQINKSIFYQYSQGLDLNHLRSLQKENASNQQTTWTYYFNAPKNKMGRAKLYLKNMGTVSLRYSWKKVIKPIEFIPETIYEPVFFFNKNDDVLYPGQEKNICFTFLSNRANIYNESWEIKFYNVVFFESPDDKFEINLSADITENLDVIKRKANNIRNAIEYRALRTMIRELVVETVTKATDVDHQVYPYKDFLLEAEMFEMKNPEHFYHETKVVDMKRHYAGMGASNWDLSIQSWRKEMMKLDYDDRMKYYDILKQKNTELLKPWTESQDVLQLKHKAVNVILCRFVDKFHDEYNDLVKKYDVYEFRKAREAIVNTYLRRQSPNPNDNVHHVHYVFYLRMYSHICTMVETCAGIISGIDLNRHIHFDFCTK